MGLAIAFGVDSEDLVDVDRVLTQEGLPQHRDPQPLPDLDHVSQRISASWSYSMTHYLRRVYAHTVAGIDIAPCPEDSNPADDPVVDAESHMFESHLLVHSDSDGYYVPVDFDEPLFDDENRIRGGIIGSSQGLLRELVRCAAPLNMAIEPNGLIAERTLVDARAAVETREDPYWREKDVWVGLYDAARLSVHYGVAICFT